MQKEKPQEDLQRKSLSSEGSEILKELKSATTQDQKFETLQRFGHILSSKSISQNIASNYQLFRPFLVTSEFEKNMKAQEVLLSLAALTDGAEIVSDVKQHILEKPSTTKANLPNLNEFLAKSGPLLRWAVFNTMADFYLDKKNHSLSEDKNKDLNSLFFSLFCDKSLLNAALNKKDSRLAKLFIELGKNPYAGHNEKEFMESASCFNFTIYERAISEDKYYYQQADYLLRNVVGHFQPSRYLEHMEKLFTLSRDEEGFVFSSMISFAILREGLAKGDIGFLKGMFEKINNIYENGKLEDMRGIAKATGLLLWRGRTSDEDIVENTGFFEKIKIALYFLTTDNIVSRMFGSVDAMLDAAQGKPPIASIMRLIKEDEKARNYTLMCVSYAIQFTEYLKDDDFKDLSFDRDVPRILKIMSQDEINETKVILQKCLNKPETQSAAQHMLDAIEAYEKGLKENKK